MYYVEDTVLLFVCRSVQKMVLILPKYYIGFIGRSHVIALVAVATRVKQHLDSIRKPAYAKFISSLSLRIVLHSIVFQ